MTESKNEINVTAKDEPKIGVYVCHCGINIGGVVSVPDLVEYAKIVRKKQDALENLCLLQDNFFIIENCIDDRFYPQQNKSGESE